MMKNIIFGIIGALMIIGTAGIAEADVWVDGYYKNNGTYVQPHYRSNANSTRLDNWSTRGNTTLIQVKEVIRIRMVGATL